MKRENQAKKEIKNQDYTESRRTTYCISQRYGSQPFSEILNNIKGALKKRNFDILLELNLDEYLKEDVKTMSPHVILSTCNTETAANVLSADIQSGIFLPCSITVKEVDQGIIEVSIEDATVTWAATKNKELAEIAVNITKTLKEILSEIDQQQMQL
ncbi:DUF302 domain-containing protein [Gramella sp. AN32]|uniref:DUF302 domain-containing protein n=1 Tax=Christiangramia antarctica TaxID=2058158 RepID=A0ABW5X3C2_9FLAO|nr:DUF302 domain-containing protein [Gramella sp. AN32]MCM4158150.1 hypothetical protein [Gramella sp. AN32]